jgi:hypothetical protein
MREVILISRDADDQLDHLLRKGLLDFAALPADASDEAHPEPVPADLRNEVIERASRATAELLALRVLSAGERAGWGPEELIEDAQGDDQELVREFLQGEADPIALSPDVFARVLWRVEFDPSEWQELLFQLVASSVFYNRNEGETWGRTTGLSSRRRADALLDDEPGEHDPERAERVAKAFVAEVVDEWSSLTAEMSDPPTSD